MLCGPLAVLQVEGLSTVNQLQLATVDFTNPFSFVLEHVYVRVEGPGILSPVYKYYA